MDGYSLLVYRVFNLGDMIQTAAISRLLPKASGVFRHRLDSADQSRLLVLNGFLYRDRPPKHDPPCLFAGVSGPHYRTRDYLEWMAKSPYPIGARDPGTLAAMQAAGIRSTLIGCATLTLPRYSGVRSGVYSVDYRGPGERLTHRISILDPVARQWGRAMQLLEKYRTAEAVYTSRLHVALPCLAYGTPVWIANPKYRAWRPSRFEIVEAMGLPYDSLVTADVSPWSRRYTEFLETNLSINIEPGEAIMPSPPREPLFGFPWWLRW